ncbi:hypothetical protein [Limosilactobacillus reuteri]|uniref:Uncharacterized protein n=1 Tax=Limosilactobacillus reuteri subsp. rodentium (strain DSM 17509 / CIP 109821 / 100-23) TaxID=349123 RepID=B3XNZ5_LIMR1|nr:hypothetical protein [Limosilactobacillus reuteri]EDX43531.1 hypothetical protein Lreu23DRAFT_5053 [Limosilactobacillus reuteri subsp. rodentium]MCC4475771.1 hypothetical protein [Limosilactobacillus reuteri]
MNPNVKRNMVQVRLNDAEMKQFEAVKLSLSEKTNAATLRELIRLAPLTEEQSQTQVKHLLKEYDDLDAKISALMWDSSNVTKNLNEIAHAANIAKNNDPTNEDTWNWIIQQLQQAFPTIQQLNQLCNETKSYLKKGLDEIGSA